MKIIIISKDGDALDLAIRLKKEGHSVKVAIQDRGYKKIGDGFGLVKAADWRRELPWVGKDGLIIFDQTGWGKQQDELRKAGYPVVGGSEGGDRLELDRQHAQDIFKKHGIKTVRSKHFTAVDEAIRFVRKNKGRWVLKQNGHVDKCFSYAGKMPDGSDVIDLLQNYKRHNHRECRSIDLQERVEGVELAVTRYFNGKEWIGPVMMNIEHKKLFPGSLGPKTSEMGTLMWFDGNETNKLFNETSNNLTAYLRTIDFRGCFDINCIVNENGAAPLEATPRFGYPTIHVEDALLESPWGEFLKAVADGEDYSLKWRKGFGIVVLVAVPPFPYQAINRKYNPEGLRIFFKERLRDDEWDHIHFSEVACIPTLEKGGKGGFSADGDSPYFVAGKSGYALCVTGCGKTVQKASSQAYDLAEKLCLPRMFYRHDIGLKFIEREQKLLKKWGYL
jgi:phosphoribosylamine--glycine ligase